MSIHFYRRQWYVAAILLAAAGGVSTCLAEPARAEADLLDRPARISSRASRSVLLAVSRAEKRLVAVGELGILLLSDDNGNTWQHVKPKRMGRPAFVWAPHGADRRAATSIMWNL